jgi:UDP-N-acetylglucosamine/UDP-N-acetylgalactosamine diphosphorylase
MFNHLKEVLHAHDQVHLLQDWEQLTVDQRQSLESQLSQIDFPLVAALYRGANLPQQDWADKAASAQSPPAVTLEQQRQPDLRARALELGEQAWRNGKVGLIIVAGGQGSRLGFEQPKGMFPIGPLSGRTLFQVQIDLVRAMAKHYGVSIPVYIMTSPATDAATREYLAEHQNLGLPAQDLQIFCQGTMPAVDAATGRLLRQSPGELALSPDGHGGMLEAFQKSGGLADATRRHLSCLFYCQIDNPLAQVCDPLLIGLHLSHHSQVTTQVVRKSEPLQRVGNVVQIDDHVEVIEYSDLPAALAHQRQPNGELKLWAGNIAVHIFDLDFLQSATRQTLEQGTGLPFHIAKKKVPFWTKAQGSVQPESENALKFERFIFDLLPLAQRAIVVEVDPADGFAAVKNADTAATETPTTARAAMVAQHRRWLQAAGVAIADHVQVEIHPDVAHDAATVCQRLANHPAITADTYLHG